MFIEFPTVQEAHCAGRVSASSDVDPQGTGALKNFSK